MTKKEFYDKINGKYVVIENAENLKKEIKADFLELLQDIKEFNTKNNTNIKYVGYKNGTWTLNNGQFLICRKVNAYLTHTQRNIKTVVRSSDVIINNCYFNKKNIIVLSDNTFTSENLKKDNIILKIVGV